MSDETQGPATPDATPPIDSPSHEVRPFIVSVELEFAVWAHSAREAEIEARDHRNDEIDNAGLWARAPISPKAMDAALLASVPYGEGPDVTIAEWFAGAHKIMGRPATLAELVPWLSRPQHAKAMTQEAVCAQLDDHRILVTNGHALLAVEAASLPAMEHMRIADEKQRDGYRLTAPGLLAEPRKNACRVSRETMRDAIRRRADGDIRIGDDAAPALRAAYVLLFVIHAMEIADQVECEVAWNPWPGAANTAWPPVRFSSAGWTAVIMPVRTDIVDVVVPPLAEDAP